MFKHFLGRVLAVTLFSLAFNLSMAQDTTITCVCDTVIELPDSLKPPVPLWKKGGTISINFAQTQLDNWAAGGQNSVAIGSLLGLFANYKRANVKWKNNLQWTYGQARLGDRDQLYKKTDDQFMFQSKFSYGDTLRKIGWAGLLDFRTQLLPGYSYTEDSTAAAGERIDEEISNFMAPGYLSLSLGAEYKPTDAFFLMASPLTGKVTFVLQDSLSEIGAYGVDPGSRVRFELGASIRMGYKKEIFKNTTFSTDLSLFTAYDENFGNIDVNWETITVFKINNFLSTTFTTQIIYDDDINIERHDGTVGPAMQYKHVLNVGLVYKFSN